MQEAKKLHAYIIVNGLHKQDHPLIRKCISLLSISNPSSLNYACSIFDSIQYHSSTFTYNLMIRAYASSPYPIQAILLYNKMHRLALPPDHYTFPFLLKACSNLPSLPKGQEAHCQLIKHGLDTSIFVQNSLIHLYGSNSDIESACHIFNRIDKRDIASWTTLITCYANNGLIEMACQLFEEMPERNAVSYSAMIAGYVGKGKFKEALRLFRDSQVAKIEPNDSMFMGVLCACANLGDFELGRWTHSYILQIKGGECDSRTTTALIDMYCKCGSVEGALCVFEKAKNKQVGEWTAMISGMAMHGFGKEAIEIFENMVRAGVEPNAVTFVTLLSACAHGGLVQEGLRYFKQMKVVYEVEPTIEHYGCVVDLLGRSGLIDEALRYVRDMPMNPNATIWGAVLSACRVYRKIEVGEITARRLISEEPWNGAIYMALLSMYSSVGRWDDVEKVKKEMKVVGCKKSPGCSVIEVNGTCYEFVAGDKSHPRALELCLILGELIVQERTESELIFSLSTLLCW